uniref:Major facilitator superfamily (MFS) profile domain-containing protein n=1 Tax=Anopheles christyi TaxID=43041 RepID=A0A182K1D9_9DIPT
MAPSAVSMVFTVESAKTAGALEKGQKPPDGHSFDEALELAGFGRVQIVLSILAGLGMMASINEAMGMSIILPASQCDLDLDAGEKGIVGGAVFLGTMCSSYFWGYLADTRGRQLILKYALFATSFFSAISCLATGFVSLLVLRFLTGVCVAAPASTVYAYLGEFTTPSRRSQMLSFASVWGGVGIVYVSLVGWWILSYDWVFVISESFEFKPWRLLFVINTMPGFLNGIAFCFCPESPKFLVSRGRNEEALEILKKVYKLNKGTDNADGYAVTSLRLDPEDAIAREQSANGSGGLFKSMVQQTLPIVKLPYLLYFIICCVHNIGAFAIYGGLGLWFPEIMNQVFSQDASHNERKVCAILQRNETLPEVSVIELCDDEVKIETFLYTLLLGIIGCIYALITSAVLGRIDQKVMMVFNCIVAGVCGIVLQFITNAYAVAILFCLEIVFAGYCVLLVNANVVAIFPTNVRAMAVALTNMIGRLSCFLASAVIGLLILQNCPVTFYMLSGLLFLCADPQSNLPVAEAKERKPHGGHTLDEALQLAGFGKVQIVLTVLSGVSMMTVVTEAVGISIILPVSQCDLGFTPWEKGILGGSMLLGIMVSSYFWGYLADTRGRQLILKYALFATSFFGAISALATGFLSLFFIRFLTGVCVAAPASTVYAYLGEFTILNRRSQVLSFASVWGGVGIVYVSLAGWWILSYDWVLTISDSFEFKPWRLLFIINTMPAFFNGIAFCFCPESPKFLVSRGRNEEALEILKKVYKLNKGTDNADGYEVTSLRLDPEDAIAREQSANGSGGLFKSMVQQTLPIMKLPYLLYFIICCVHNVGAFTIYGGLGLWFPDIMNHLFSPNATVEGNKVCSVLQQNGTQAIEVELCNDAIETFFYTIISGVLSIVQGLTVSLMLGRIDVKNMTMFNFTVAGICGVALQFVSNSYAVAILFCLMIVFAGHCVVLVNANVVAIFTTNVRAMTIGMTNIFGRLSGFVASTMLGNMMLVNCELTLIMLSLLMF